MRCSLLEPSRLCIRAYQYTKATRNLHTGLIAQCSIPMNEGDKSKVTEKIPSNSTTQYDSLLEHIEGSKGPSSPYYADTINPDKNEIKSPERYQPPSRKFSIRGKSFQLIRMSWNINSHLDYLYIFF